MTELKNFIAIGIMLLFNTLLIGFTLFFLFPKSEGVASGVYSGLLSGIGAVIGGIITFFGVRVTLNNQSNDRFVDTFPKKAEKISAIISNFEYPGLLAKGFNSLNELAQKNTFAKILKEAAETDGYVYAQVEALRNFGLSQIELIKNDPKCHVTIITDSDKLSIDSEENRKAYRDNFINEVTSTRTRLETHLEKLQKKFVNLAS